MAKNMVFKKEESLNNKISSSGATSGIQSKSAPKLPSGQFSRHLTKSKPRPTVDLSWVPHLKMSKKPFEYQRQAIKSVCEGFSREDRGQLIMPCGTGKTLVSLWIFEELNVAHTLVIFPSLALLRQTKNEWATNHGNPFSYMCVCSEKDIDTGEDALQVDLKEIGRNVSTDPNAIREFLQKNDQAVVFSTYQSLEAVSQALNGTSLSFDLAICDEAHKTAGMNNSYSLIHDNSKIPVTKRLYMTATPRVMGKTFKTRIKGDKNTYIADMDDPQTFGHEFYRMSFKEAIDLGILVDYQIFGIGVTDDELHAYISANGLAEDGTSFGEIAHNYALEKFMKKHNTNCVVTFHSSIKKASDFQKRHLSLFKEVSCFHVNGTQSTSERNMILKAFEAAPKSIVTNARCLTEGVDIPAIDAVYFCDPKKSKVDIVQATGRALRRANHRKKRRGYIVVPLFHKKGENIDHIVEEGKFGPLVEVIRSLSNHDERLQDEIQKNQKNKQLGLALQPIKSDGDRLVLIEGINEEYKDYFFDEVINNFKLPWKSFEESRKYVCNLNLSGQAEWNAYCKSGEKPSDIPSNPDRVYKNKGWVSFGDWLGTGAIATFNRKYLPIDLAKQIVWSLNLSGHAEWNAYCKSGNKPSDIPSNPRRVYENKGWVSWGDWLSTGTIATRNRKYLPIDLAKQIVWSLNLSGQAEWNVYCKSGNKPSDIPSKPDRVYKNKGWVSWGDWLGTGAIATRNRKYLPIDLAKQIVSNLNLSGHAEWNAYCKSGEKPANIPSKPDRVYKNKGWVSWGDWLGTGAIATRNRKYLPIDSAKQTVSNLNLSGQAEWNAYCKSGEKPANIPGKPNRVYKNKGWVSWGDWLGKKF